MVKASTFWKREISQVPILRREECRFKSFHFQVEVMFVYE